MVGYQNYVKLLMCLTSALHAAAQVGQRPSSQQPTSAVPATSQTEQGSSSRQPPWAQLIFNGPDDDVLGGRGPGQYLMPPSVFYTAIASSPNTYRGAAQDRAAALWYLRNPPERLMYSFNEPNNTLVARGRLPMLRERVLSFVARNAGAEVHLRSIAGEMTNMEAVGVAALLQEPEARELTLRITSSIFDTLMEDAHLGDDRLLRHMGDVYDEAVAYAARLTQSPGDSFLPANVVNATARPPT